MHAQLKCNPVSAAATLVGSDDRLLSTFLERCEARAILVMNYQMGLQEAVDGLWDAAVAYGLIDRLGTDAVQAILARAFEHIEHAP